MNIARLLTLLSALSAAVVSGCCTASVTAQTAAQDPAGSPGLLWRGTYSPTASYVTTDAVFFNGSSYIALEASTGIAPAGSAGSATAWSLVAEQGQTGAQGPSGPQGTPGAQGPQGAAGVTGLLPVPAAGSVLYFEGSSITGGQGLTCPGTVNQNEHNCDFAGLIGSSIWGSAASVYDDGVDGATSTSVLRYYTVGGNSFSAHSLSPKTTGSIVPNYYLLDLTEVVNDAATGISASTSISNLQKIVSAAQADGWFVVLITSPVQGQGPNPPVVQAIQSRLVAQAARDHTIPSNLLVDLTDTMPNQADQVYYADGTHPTAIGHAALAANILAALSSNGQPINYSGGHHSIPQYLHAGAVLYDSNNNPWLLQVSPSGQVSASPTQ